MADTPGSPSRMQRDTRPGGILGSSSKYYSFLSLSLSFSFSFATECAPGVCRSELLPATFPARARGTWQGYYSGIRMLLLGPGISMIIDISRGDRGGLGRCNLWFLIRLERPRLTDVCRFRVLWIELSWESIFGFWGCLRLMGKILIWQYYIDNSFIIWTSELNL